MRRNGMLKLVILHWMLTSQTSNSCNGVQRELFKGLGCKWGGGRSRVRLLASLSGPCKYYCSYGVVIAMLARGVFPFLTDL
jgi:hypothetical protein